jgi:predicted N-acyltransferase
LAVQPPQRVASIDAVDSQAWNALAGTECPFLRHEFLAALEHTGCVGGSTGWQPEHFLLHDEQGLLGAIPAYRKSHSWGEFVFDFGWAQAYARAGRSYYPKLIAAVPFSPASGARLLVRPDVDTTAVASQLITLLQAAAADEGLSSAHVLFPAETDRALLEQAGWLLRRDCQFHWRNEGYADFEAYLATFTAEKRKKTRRERRRCEEAGINFLTLRGPELSAPLLDVVYEFHAQTFRRHGNEPYLTREFFTRICATLGDALMVKLALQGKTPVAAAIFFCSPAALYGRYWGSLADFHSLHFETCYHQGIEFCIEHGIGRFEPGTQGEHKISRGFGPALTWSAHYIADPRFRVAIADFLAREAPAIDAYADEVGRHTPFRRG